MYGSTFSGRDEGTSPRSGAAQRRDGAGQRYLPERMEARPRAAGAESPRRPLPKPGGQSRKNPARKRGGAGTADLTAERMVHADGNGKTVPTGAASRPQPAEPPRREGGVR